VHGAVRPGRAEGLDQLVDRAAAERVEALGPVNGDDRDRAIDLIADVFERFWHGTGAFLLRTGRVEEPVAVALARTVPNPG
jgi:hypothetical protein